ncbi:hypothetical protein BV508_30975, partial [Mycobacterium intermedium]
MSFLTLPPEINSLNLLLGAGSAPLTAVASAWDGLAAELSSASSFFESVTSGLVNGAWQGPASGAMAAAASPYAAWLSAAGIAAEEAASQARVVVAAFESARSMIVHPAVIAGNRNSLVRLAVSNLFGQNWPAIAAVESAYEEFWAQDVVAMLSYYGGASSAVSALTPFTKLPLGQLAGAVAQVAGVAGAGGGGVKAVVAGLSSGNVGGLRLGSLLGGFNLSGLLGSLRLGTGNLANLGLHSLGDAGTGAAAAAGRWGSFGRHFGSWGGFGGAGLQAFVPALSGVGLGSVFSGGTLSAVLSTGSL